MWHGEASLTRGNLQGMLSLHRVGDMDLTPDGNNLIVKGILGFTVLQVKIFHILLKKYIQFWKMDIIGEYNTQKSACLLNCGCKIKLFE